MGRDQPLGLRPRLPAALAGPTAASGGALADAPKMETHGSRYYLRSVFFDHARDLISRHRRIKYQGVTDERRSVSLSLG